MNRIRILVCLTLLLSVLAIVAPAAAQAPRDPDVNLSASIIDEQGAALPLHGHIEVEVTDYGTATESPGDPDFSCHPSASAVPNATVWFKFSVPIGELTLSLAGSSISHDTTGASDMLLAVFRQANEVGCASGNNTTAPVLSGLALPAGSYYAVVGVPNTASVNTGTLYVTLDYAPETRLSNDNFAKAKTIKIPSNPSIGTLENTTYEPDEVVSSCATVDRPSNSAWYKLTLPQISLFSVNLLYAQGLSGDGVMQADDFIVTIFADTEFGLQEVECATNGLAASTYVTPGTYYIRIEINNQIGLSAGGVVTFIANTSISTGTPQFYSPEGNSPDFTGWKAKNATAEDAIVCAVTCAYVFTSEGATEATEISTKARMSMLKLKKNDIIGLAVIYTSTAPDATAQLTVTYTDGTPTKKVTMPLDIPGGDQAVASVMLKSGSVGSIKAKIRNHSMVADDTLTISIVFMSALRVGKFAPRGVLPLPPAPAQ